MSENPAPVTAPLTTTEPDALSWPAPAGVLASPEGIQAALAALGFQGVVRREDGLVHFSAARREMRVAALGGAVAGVLAYVLADRLGATPMISVAAVVLAALLVPPLFAPAYTLNGRIDGGRIFVRLRARGLLARRDKLASRLRFYLERPAPGRPPSA